MSTHSLDASGARPLTSTTNDPRRTAATVSAKEGDDCVVTLGNYQRVEIPLHPNVQPKLVVRKRVARVAKRDNQGDFVRDENRHVVYEDAEEEQRLLVFEAGINLSAHTIQADPKYTGPTPHSTFRIVNLEKDPNQPLWVQGEIVSEETLDVGFAA